MKKQYTFFNDPGHAWLKVTKAELLRLGIADQISSFSYMDNRHAYLEEDSDASRFIETLTKQGIEIEIEEHFTNDESKIRSYPQYTAAKKQEKGTFWKLVSAQ